MSWPVNRQKNEMAGTVSPMVATTEPNAQFKAVCRALRPAARIAFSDSGKSTSAASAAPLAALTLRTRSISKLSSIAGAT